MKIFKDKKPKIDPATQPLEESAAEEQTPSKEQEVSGATVTIEPTKCVKCEGTGLIAVSPHKLERCPDCYGTGKIK